MQPEIQDHKDLIVWQKGIDLVEQCYRMTERFPKHQLFGLTNQLQRAAISIPANIAEGHGRRSTGDYLRFLSIARGSLCELETHVVIAQRLRYMDSKAVQELLQASAEIGRMLNGLITALKKRQA